MKHFYEIYEKRIGAFQSHIKRFTKLADKNKRKAHNNDLSGEKGIYFGSPVMISPLEIERFKKINKIE